MKFILFISLLVSIILNANASNSYDTKEVSKFIDYMAKNHDYKKMILEIYSIKLKRKRN